jgi:putative RNA 2'-phosphotransferase
VDHRQTTKTSKFLSLVLRHEPGTIGITLDDAGWTDVAALLAAMATNGTPLTRGQLEHVVNTSDKKRFTFSDDGLRIRASQGHSVEVELGYEPMQPPEVLYHGTAGQFLESIRRTGLDKRGRHDVHLSETPATATTVGGRRGEAVVLIVAAGQMHRDGFSFRRSANGVWLVDAVPAKYLAFP